MTAGELTFGLCWAGAVLALVWYIWMEATDGRFGKAFIITVGALPVWMATITVAQHFFG